MSKDLSIRGALLELRQFVADDAGRKARMAELSAELNKAVDDRVAAAKRVVDTWTKLTGFDGQLDALLVAGGSAKQSKPRKKGKRKATKQSKKKDRVETKQSTVKTRRGGRPSAQGFPGELDVTISLSPVEQKLSDLLVERWPLFTSPTMLVYKNILTAPNQAGATINRLRQKGLPIESAKQARKNDSEISSKQVGYRLISG